LRAPGRREPETAEIHSPKAASIRSAAAQISSRIENEKQAFLKVIYENFYKVYNKRAADTHRGRVHAE